MSDMEARLTSLEEHVHKADVVRAKENAELGSEIKRLANSIDNMVLRVEFAPVRSLVFGGVGVIITAVLAAMLGFVIVRNG